SAFSESVTIQGTDATIDRLVASLPLAEVVHFAGHAYTQSDNGALLFAPKDPKSADWELLRPLDVLRQDWSGCRLVVLSACSTAIGESRGAHNPESLVRAFTRAGTPRVVASLWSVDSASTVELMKAFYSSLARGTRAGEALVEAEREIRERPAWIHP